MGLERKQGVLRWIGPSVHKTWWLFVGGGKEVAGIDQFLCPEILSTLTDLNPSIPDIQRIREGLCCNENQTKTKQKMMSSIFRKRVDYWMKRKNWGPKKQVKYSINI